MSDQRAVARAIDAMRRGWPIAIDGLTLLAVETADRTELDAFADAPILITAGRALTLKLANQKDAATPDAPVLVAHEPWFDHALAVALADPALDMATPFKGPFRAVTCVKPDSAAAALILARHAGLLPAFYVGSAAVDHAAEATAVGVAAFEAPERLAIAARAKLPVEATESAEIVAFRTPGSANDHVALLVGAPDGDPPLVRLHSECLTGDVLGSLKCDCGPQLDLALRLIAESGWGILLYLRQEGRGIGLVNKLRAYQLQDQGFDTVDANTRLGFAVDARDFGTAAMMLKLLGQDRVRLLTNNPQKVARLEENGVAVVERVSHTLPPNPHNQRYLETKRDRSGHQL